MARCACPMPCVLVEVPGEKENPVTLLFWEVFHACPPEGCRDKAKEKPFLNPLWPRLWFQWSCFKQGLLPWLPQTSSSSSLPGVRGSGILRVPACIWVLATGPAATLDADSQGDARRAWLVGICKTWNPFLQVKFLVQHPWEVVQRCCLALFTGIPAEEWLGMETFWKLCFFQVTHLCWVPREPYVLQTSEDKTIRWAHWAAVTVFLVKICGSHAYTTPFPPCFSALLCPCQGILPLCPSLVLGPLWSGPIES